ncbi:MAG: hypothetical protein D6714_15600 [Bacteroidetes bacterium]|nr:MAG: hypothetical protein D6714_15600 [Bacteroidota bacterium]
MAFEGITAKRKSKNFANNERSEHKSQQIIYKDRWRRNPLENQNSRRKTQPCKAVNQKAN